MALVVNAQIVGVAGESVHGIPPIADIVNQAAINFLWRGLNGDSELDVNPLAAESATSAQASGRSQDCDGEIEFEHDPYNTLAISAPGRAVRQFGGRETNAEPVK